MIGLAVYVVLSLLATSVSASLPGSCVAAGYTECCVTGGGQSCHGQPPFCLCDPSCHMYDDCCDDIAEICTPDFLQPQPPAVLLAVNVTFHSATLLWGKPSEEPLNVTYTVCYWTQDSPDEMQSTNVQSVDHMLQTTVVALSPGQTYQWSVEVVHTLGSTRSLTSNFSTLSYAKLEGFQVRVLNTSAVVVSWLPPVLPVGVQLIKYIIYHTPTSTGTSQSLEVENAHIWNNTMLANYGTIRKLDSDQIYLFWGEAVIKEVDGSITTGVVSRRNATVFVPDSTTVQIRGGPFQPCHRWNEQTESQVLKIFRYMTLRAIHGAEECELHLEQIGQDLVLCEAGGTSGTSSAVYRATLYSTPNRTTQLVRSLVEQQVVGGDASNDPILSALQVDSTCPVSIQLGSEPLCGNHGGEKPTDCTKLDNQIRPLPQQTENCSCQQEAESGMVPVPVVVAALAAELLLMVCFLMMVLATVLIVRRRRYSAKTLEPSPTETNVYS